MKTRTLVNESQEHTLTVVTVEGGRLVIPPGHGADVVADPEGIPTPKPGQTRHKFLRCRLVTPEELKARDAEEAAWNRERYLAYGAIAELAFKYSQADPRLPFGHAIERAEAQSGSKLPENVRAGMLVLLFKVSTSGFPTDVEA